MNRSDRRRIAREAQKNRGAPITRSQANTPETRLVYDAGYSSGKDEGINFGIEHSYKSCYAAAVLALVHQYHPDEDQVIDFLREMDGIIHQSLSSDELTRMVYKEIGLQIDFGNGIEPYLEFEEDI